MKPTNELTDKSLKRYRSVFNTYGTILTISKFDDWLGYLDKRELSDISKRVLFTSILHFHKELKLSKQKDIELVKRVRKELDKLIERERAKKSNQLEINTTYEELKPLIELKGRDRIIYNLYIKQAPRRNQDYQHMYIWTRKGIPKKTDRNYYLIHKGYFLFNSYKTHKTYGQQEIKVSDDLNDILREYVKDKKNGDSLLNIKQANLSTRIKKIFGISMNEIRHLYVDKLFKENPNRSTDEIKKISTLLGHSIRTHLNYRTKAVCKDENNKENTKNMYKNGSVMEFTY